MELDNNIQNAASEGTTPNEPETQQAEAEVNASDTAPQDPTAADVDAAQVAGNGADTDNQNQNAENEPYLTIRFNHETRNLSLEEARLAAQKGIRFSEISEKLDRAAAIKGVSATELLDSMISAERDSYRASIVEKIGEDGEAVEKLMKLYDIEQAEKYKQAIENRKAEAQKNEHSLNERLASEFLTLKGEFPEYAEYGNLPAEVRREAESGKDLMSSLLLHRHREEKKTAAAKEAEAAAAKATAGSLSGEADNVDTAEKDFLRGLWG